MLYFYFFCPSLHVAPVTTWPRPFFSLLGVIFFPASRCFAAALMRSRNASPPPFLPPRRFLIPEGYKPCVVASVLLCVVVVAAVIVVVAAAGSSMMVVLALCGAAALLILGLAVCLCRSLCCVKGERQHPLLEKRSLKKVLLPPTFVHKYLNLNLNFLPSGKNLLIAFCNLKDTNSE